jgi:transcriptional regulator with XRE-family HTH domain
MPLKIDAESRIAESPLNRQAGLLLRRARDISDMPQGEFALAVARRLGLGALSQSAISDWELGKRQVPAAALMAGAYVARVEFAELVAADAKSTRVAARLMRDIERVIGTLTPEQEKRLRAVDGNDDL